MSTGRGIGAYSKFWVALGVAVSSLIVALSDRDFAPEEIAAVGPQFVAAFLVFASPNVGTSTATRGAGPERLDIPGPPAPDLTDTR